MRIKYQCETCATIYNREIDALACERSETPPAPCNVHIGDMVHISTRLMGLVKDTVIGLTLIKNHNHCEVTDYHHHWAVVVKGEWRLGTSFDTTHIVDSNCCIELEKDVNTPRAKNNLGRRASDKDRTVSVDTIKNIKPSIIQSERQQVRLATEDKLKSDLELAMA